MNSLKTIFWCVVAGAIFFICVDALYPNGVGYTHASAQTHVQAVSQSSVRSSSDSVLGPPSVTPQFIDQVLAAAHSPARGIGQTMYDEGVKHHIDPVYALAFFKHESSFGLWGVAAATLSIGNIRCTAGWACDPSRGYRKYPSWSASIDDWYSLIDTVYVSQGLTTVSKIIPVYAPNADHNNEAVYIQSVMGDVTRWRQGTV